jgi:superfamily II RNA helicase
MMKMANLDRAKAGSLFDVYESIRDKMEAGQTLSEAGQEALADRVVQRYSTHIKAAFRKYNFNLQDDEVLDSQTLVRCINEKSGMDIRSLTPDGVLAGVDKMISGRMSELLGVEVTTLTNLEAAKQSLINAAVQSVRSGRASALISKAMIKKIKEKKTWRDNGVSEVKSQAMLNAWYQKKFRRTHVGVWREK